MKIIVETILVALLSAVPLAAEDGVAPFGIKPGTPVEALDRQAFFDTDGFVRVTAPNPYPGFQNYYVWGTPKAGVCETKAEGAVYGFEEKAKELSILQFDEIRGQLEKRYGTSVTDIQTSWLSSIESSRSWLEALERGDQKYMAIWNAPNSSGLPANIQQIQLSIYSTPSLGSGASIRIEYFFSNWEDCSAENKLANDKSSAL
jgi:hypothetical protein